MKLNVYDGDSIIHTTQVSEWAAQFFKVGQTYWLKIDDKLRPTQLFKKDDQWALSTQPLNLKKPRDTSKDGDD